MLSKFKDLQLKAGNTQNTLDRLEKMEQDLKGKNLELADMLRERDRARYDFDRQKASSKEELESLRREVKFANERGSDLSRAKSNEVSSVMKKFNRQLSELEDTLRVSWYEI